MGRHLIHDSPRVLITDAAERSMLGVCRGLDAGGYDVSAAAFAPLAPGHWSRCCSHRLRITDPRVDLAGFVDDLRSYLERRPCAVLIPGSDYSLFAVSRERSALERLTQIGLPPHDVVQRSFKREILAQAAEAAGLSPAGAVRCVDEAEAVHAARELGYPVLLKSISTVRDLGATVAAGSDTRKVADEQELRGVLPLYGDSWLVQGCVYGRTLSFGGAIADGQLLGAAVSEYRRTWPPAAGNVSFSVTIEPPAGLSERVAALLRHIGWEGLFELELIRDRSGAITPIDLNPRPYGSMALAVGAGVNLPALWCDWLLRVPACAGTGARTAGAGARTAGTVARTARASARTAGTGARGPASDGDGTTDPAKAAATTLPPVVWDGHHPTVQARPGRAYRWEDADLRHLAWQLRHRHYAAAARVMRPWPGAIHPHFRVRDPLPLVVRGASLAVEKLRARRGQPGLSGRASA